MFIILKQLHLFASVESILAKEFFRSLFIPYHMYLTNKINI